MSPKLVAVLLLVAFALAGCLGGDDVDADDDSDINDGNGAGQITDDTDGEGKRTDDDGNGEAEHVNEPPIAGLSADISSGVSPVEVIFTLTADDPDGDNLTWVLDLNETVMDGTNSPDEFPIEINYTFTTNVYPFVNHTVTFKVTDGEFDDEASVSIEVLRGPNAAQEGEVSTCVRNFALPGWGIIMGEIGDENDPELVDVEGGTYYSAETDTPEATIQIAFINDEGDRILTWGETGRTPPDAVTASVCVSAGPENAANLPVPVIGAGFIFQDGFALDQSD